MQAQDEDAKRWGAELRVIGDLSLAPPALQAAAARLMRGSREPATTSAGTAAGAGSTAGTGPGAGGRRVVNICFSYTSTQELQAAAGQLVAGLAECELLPHDVTPSLLQCVMHTQVGWGGVSVCVGCLCVGGVMLCAQTVACVSSRLSHPPTTTNTPPPASCLPGHTQDCPPVDLLVRTSGEQRLSDFLCWQSAHALLHWERCRWPEFGYAQLLRALLAWQAAAPQLAALRAAAAASLAQLEAGGQCEQELLLAGSCGGSGGASPPGGLLPMYAAQQPGGGWQQQQDTASVLDQLQRSSEVLAQLQKQQQQLWWGGLLFSPGSGQGSGGGGSPLYPTAAALAAAAAAPAGRSPERASSTSLSVISEDEAAHAPHPWQPLRLEGWLRRLEDEREQRLAQLATAGGAV
jgi:undecaprenyl pyrophosphate synthase